MNFNRSIALILILLVPGLRPHFKKQVTRTLAGYIPQPKSTQKDIIKTHRLSPYGFMALDFSLSQSLKNSSTAKTALIIIHHLIRAIAIIPFAKPL